MGIGAIVVLAIVLIALAWFFLPSRSSAGVVRKERPDVDEIELERAEREVQEAPDEERVRDWGPGTGQKPLP
jgi:beta-lactam-binding protein with PASTA domain